MLIYVEANNSDFDLIVLTECYWRGISECWCPYEGYDMIITVNKINQNEGTIIYVKQSLLVMS